MGKFICNNCGLSLETEETAGRQITCPVCDTPLLIPHRESNSAPPFFNGRSQSAVFEESEGVTSSMNSKIASALGMERLEGFSLAEFFSSALKKHTTEEIEERFTFGTAKTTPPLFEVVTEWPKPWAFFRALIFSIIVYAIFYYMYIEYRQIHIVPGLIITGAFAVPLSVLILFMEVNVTRNVSMYQVVKMLFMGGVLSLLVTLFLNDKLPFLQTWLGASSAGGIEEIAKVAATLLMVKDRRYSFTLNGLLIGAAVGTGFAAFETAGYAFRCVLESGDLMLQVITSRALLAPAMHIPWTALAAAALWRVKGDRNFQNSMLLDFRFLRVLAFSIALHMLWNSSFTIISLPFVGDIKYLLLGSVAWIAVFSFIQDGLRQVDRVKHGGAYAAPSSSGNKIFKLRIIM